MPDLIERCDRQLKGECTGCKFDCLEEKEKEGMIILYSVKNSQCGFYEITTLFA